MSQVNNALARLLTTATQNMLKYDPKTVKKLKPMAGKKIKINIQPIDQSLVLAITADSIEVSADEGQAVDTTISGKPSALFAMSTNQHIPGLDGVNIQGDASLGQFVAEVLKQLKPDWEDAWCDLLGEGPGYQVATFLKSVKKAGSSLLQSIHHSTKEYLLEENRELVSPHEMETFLDEVDDLQADLSRLERKLQKRQNPA